MMSIVLWFIAVLCIIFLLRLIVKKYTNWVEDTSTATLRTRRLQPADRRVYTIDGNINHSSTITRQNQCYDDDSYYNHNQPPPEYSINNLTENNISGNIRREIIIKSKNELPTYEEVIKQIRETQQQNNNNSNNVNINRVVDTSLPSDENNNNTRTTSATPVPVM